MKKLSQNDLINFEEKVANLFNNKKIKFPVHLYSGNEKVIIKIFKKIKNED
jgi:TPP-dependent pyruvate/acetoin dehydrogenase alpha subunit